MNTDWNILCEKLKSFNNTITNPNFKGAVTTSMPRTFLLGNGDISVISNGGKNYKEYMFSKNDFWSCGDLKTDAVMNFDARRVSILPIGSLVIEDLSSDHFFFESIDITDCSITSKYDNVLINAVCYSEKNAVLLKISSESTQTIRISVKAKDSAPEYPCSVFSENGNMYAQRSTANFAKCNPLSWTSVVAMRLDCISGEFKYLSNTDSTITYELNLRAGETGLLSLSFGGGGKTYDCKDVPLGKTPWVEAQKTADSLNTSERFNDALSLNKKWWKNYWLLSFVELSDYQLEKYYYTSLYLMACCSRENKMPPGLYGNFITTDNPKWNGDFHLNYNFIAPFYGMYAANRCVFAKTLAKPMIDFIPEGRRRAKEDLELVCKQYVNGGIIKRQIFKGRRDLKHGINDGVLYPVALGP